MFVFVSVSVFMSVSALGNYVPAGAIQEQVSSPPPPSPQQPSAPPPRPSVWPPPLQLASYALPFDEPAGLSAAG